MSAPVLWMDSGNTSCSFTHNLKSASWHLTLRDVHCIKLKHIVCQLLELGFEYQFRVLSSEECHFGVLSNTDQSLRCDEIALCSCRWLPLPEGGLFLMASMAFTAEYLLFYFHSTTHAGLEGRYHEILVMLIGLCILGAVLAAAYPQKFVVDLACSLALTLQGAWFYCTAYTLYGPLMPTGCMDRGDTIVCESETAEKRGQVFAIVQLSVLVVCLWVLVLGTFAIVAHFYGPPDLFYPVPEPNEISNESDRSQVSLS